MVILILEIFHEFLPMYATLGAREIRIKVETCEVYVKEKLVLLSSPALPILRLKYMKFV